MLKHLCRILAVASVLVATAAARGEAVNGQPAPDFTLPDASGQSHTLSDLRGKYVVLEWVNHGCPFVKKHYNSGNMQALQKEFTAKGVVWLSICSSAEGKQGYYTAEEWPTVSHDKGSAATAVLLDPQGTVGRLYDAKTTPDMFVINPEGVLIYQGAIDDKPTPDPEDIPGSHNYVKAALDQAMSGGDVAVGRTKSYGCSVKYAD